MGAKRLGDTRRTAGLPVRIWVMLGLGLDCLSPKHLSPMACLATEEKGENRRKWNLKGRRKEKDGRGKQREGRKEKSGMDRRERGGKRGGREAHS